jgi:hypothetical protein
MVKSVSIEQDSESKSIVKESSGEYNWINPNRAATDEEIDLMLNECEAEYIAGKCLSIEEAKKKTLNDIREWKKQK